MHFYLLIFAAAELIEVATISFNLFDENFTSVFMVNRIVAVQECPSFHSA
jgi:hypothetical protein